MCRKQLTLMDLLSSCLSVPLQERRERGRETKAEINSFVTELCSFTRQDKAAVQVGCRWDQLSTVCLILYGVQSRDKKSLNCTMIYWQGQCCLTEPCNFPCACNHRQGRLHMVLGSWLEQGGCTRCKRLATYPHGCAFYPHGDMLSLVQIQPEVHSISFSAFAQLYLALAMSQVQEDPKFSHALVVGPNAFRKANCSTLSEHTSRCLC